MKCSVTIVIYSQNIQLSSTRVGEQDLLIDRLIRIVKKKKQRIKNRRNRRKKITDHLPGSISPNPVHRQYLKEYHLRSALERRDRRDRREGKGGSTSDVLSIQINFFSHQILDDRLRIALWFVTIQGSEGKGGRGRERGFAKSDDMKKISSAVIQLVNILTVFLQFG